MPNQSEVHGHFTTADGCITRAMDTIRKRGFPDDPDEKAKLGALSELGKAKKALERLRDAALRP